MIFVFVLFETRAENAKDLIFKQGNAKKAAVRIIFDNTIDPHHKMPYKNEISVERSIDENGNKIHKINGKKVKPEVYKELFTSIRLDVNQPNQFLILQVHFFQPNSVFDLPDLCVCGCVCVGGGGDLV